MTASNKVSCSTSIDAVVIKEARELNLSPLAILEEALGKAVKVAKYERWWRDNRQAITEHNRKTANQGTFSERIGQYLSGSSASPKRSGLHLYRDKINAGIDLLIGGFLR